MYQIIKEDFLEAKLSDCVDLTITSPPYNLNIQYGKYQDMLSYEDYLVFSSKYLSKIYEATKDTGRLCLNIPLDTNYSGSKSIYADVLSIALGLGWKYKTTIVWNEGNISNRNAWGSWLSASAPNTITPVEMIIVLYKDSWKKNYKGVSDIQRDEFISWTNGLWSFNGESKKRIGHPAPYPRELPKRCIKLFSYKGDTILDPFLGSGTTLIETELNDRIGIGYELSSEYCSLAEKRIKECLSNTNMLKD